MVSDDEARLRRATIDLDKRYLWHPYTAMEPYIESGEPLVIMRAEGARLFDANGRSYIDGNASWWTSLLGHNHPRLVAALCRQSEQLCHTSLAGVTHPRAAELAEALVRIAPEGLTRVYYSDNGSTAVELAIKLAVQYWGQNGAPRKTRFASLDGAFHGETLGVTALGGVAEFRRPFETLCMPCTHLPSPAASLDRALSALERTLREQADTLAALVVEPMVQGAGGMRLYAAEYLTRARQLTREHDVLLIADEVFTGYGRTGPMWASEHAEVAPDILCAAKGLSGGLLPFAATLVSEALFEGFLGGPERALLYGHTYCGNPLGAAVALEVLNVYREERVLERARSSAERLGKAFRELAELPNVKSARSLGMIAALDLVGGEGYHQRGGWAVYQQALERGIYARPLGNTVYLAPPLNIDEETLDELLSGIQEAVMSVAASGSPR